MAKKIIENLQEVARDLLSFCLQTEKCIYVNIIKVFQDASEHYSKNKYKYWPFFMWRTRDKDFNYALNTFRQFDCEIFILQALSRFFTVGEWRTSSGNTQVFLRLIESLKGYEPEEKKYIVETILQPLKDCLLREINEQLSQHKKQLHNDKELFQLEEGNEEQLSQCSIMRYTSSLL